MKRINKFALFILGALSFASCSDINDIESEGYRITGEQIDDATSVIPSRVEAKIAGMYSSMGTVCAAFPSDTRDDDGGYPTVCLSQDLNGPDMICANNGYNWFSVSSEYSDRYATYANPFARYAIFYNQIKAANDIILSIDPATASETEKYYLGQAKAVRAFDYLCLAPYYQFRYATSKDLPCVPLITEETTNFVNNPRATVGKVYEQIISDLNSAIDLLEGYNRREIRLVSTNRLLMGYVHVLTCIWECGKKHTMMLIRQWKAILLILKKKCPNLLFMIYPIITGCGELTFLYLW